MFHFRCLYRGCKSNVEREEKRKKKEETEETWRLATEARSPETFQHTTKPPSKKATLSRPRGHSWCAAGKTVRRLCLDASSRSTWDYANGTIDLHKQHRETVEYTITRVLWPYDENPRACSTSRRVFYPYANPSPTRGIPRLALDSRRRIDEEKTKVASPCSRYQGVTSWYTSLTTILLPLPFVSLASPSPSASRSEPLRSRLDVGLRQTSKPNAIAKLSTGSTYTRNNASHYRRFRTHTIVRVAWFSRNANMRSERRREKFRLFFSFFFFFSKNF